MHPKTYLQLQAFNQIQAGDWQNAGVPYVVVGQIKTIDANTFEIHYQLYDVQKQQYLLNEVLTVRSSSCSSSWAYDQ